jgi:formylglycine-generating enzyme required for sulfatase activity
LNGYSACAGPYGALDMVGNVAEWVNDWYDVYPGGDVTASTGDAGFGQKERLARGGSWFRNANHIRSANRFHAPPLTASNDMQDFPGTARQGRCSLPETD